MDEHATYSSHPAAELFPTLNGKDYAAFKADLQQHGLREAIWLCEGQILDGRNRYRACRELGIEPRFREYRDASPVAFVWSLNGTRRHLSAGQLAAVAVNMLPALAEEAKKRQQQHGGSAPGKSKETLSSNLNQVFTETGKAATQAAAITGAGQTNVYQAKRVKTADPELFRRIETGEVSVNKAVQMVTGKEQPLNRQARNQPRDKRIADLQRLAAEGYRATQIADALGVGEAHVRALARESKIALPDAQIGRTNRIDPKRVIEATVTGLDAYALGLQTIGGELHVVAAAEAREWAASLTESLRPLNRLRKQLLEIVNGHNP